MERTIYKTSKKKIAIMFGIFTVAMPLSAIAAYFVPRILDHVIGALPLVIIVLVYAILVVSIIGFFAGLIRLVGGGFNLILNEKGIQNNAEFGKNKIVLWTDIERIELGPTGLGIAIFLKDPQKYVDSFTGLKKQGIGLINIKYGTPCYINVTALKADVDELVEKMNQLLIQYKS